MQIDDQHLKVANKKRFQQKTLPTSMLPIHNYDKSKLVMLLVKLGYHMVHEILHLKFFFGRSILAELRSNSEIIGNFRKMENCYGHFITHQK